MPGKEPDPIEMVGGFETSGSNQSGMRERNERLVLTILRREGALPKAEIARRTGLSAQTVSVIMRALETDGLLERGEKLRGKVGQPSVPMRLAAKGAFFLGFKVGRRSAELILVDFVGQEVAHITKVYAFPTPDMMLEFATQAILEIRAHLSEDDQGKIAGLGIAMPFFLWEWSASIGVDPDKMAAWRDFDLAAELRARLDFPVFVGNDATSACGAELVFGETETPADFLYVYIGYFIGGGVVLNGALHAGRFNNAGAIGTYPVNAPKSTHEQLVERASLIGLERRVALKMGDASDMLGQQDAWDIDPDIIDEWLDDVVPRLVQMIVGAISIIDFPSILIDGNMPRDLRDAVVARVDQALLDMPLSGLYRPDILPGSLGPRARALGAASLPLSKRFMLET